MIEGFIALAVLEIILLAVLVVLLCLVPWRRYGYRLKKWLERTKRETLQQIEIACMRKRARRLS